MTDDLRALGFRSGDGVTYGFETDECDYDCYLTIKKRRGHGVAEVLGKMFKRDLKSRNLWPDGCELPDYEPILDIYLKKLIKWKKK